MSSEPSEQGEFWKNCDNKDGGGCDSPAHVSYVWPGRTREYACLAHAVAIANVAKAMGMPLEFESYHGEDALQALREEVPSATS